MVCGTWESARIDTCIEDVQKIGTDDNNVDREGRNVEEYIEGYDPEDKVDLSLKIKVIVLEVETCAKILTKGHACCQGEDDQNEARNKKCIPDNKMDILCIFKLCHNARQAMVKKQGKHTIGE